LLKKSHYPITTVNEKITELIKEAMRAKDQTALTVLRALKSALKYAAIEKLGAEGELDETDSLAVIRREIKKRQDSFEQFTNAQRTDLAQKEQAEIGVLEQFLPAALSPAELTAYVTQAIAETGATSKAQMGLVMKRLGELTAGRADGKTMSQAVMAHLS
jgi:hypothetical protein